MKNILVIRTDRMGDALMNVPLIHRLKQNYPTAMITLICDNNLKDLFRYHLSISRIVGINNNRLKSLGGKLELFNRLRKFKFDCGITTQPHKFYHLLLFLLGIKVRIGFNRKWGFFLNQKIEDNKSDGQHHEIDYNLSLIDYVCKKRWDGQIDLGFDMYPQREKVIEKYGFTVGKKRIVFHVMSSNPQKTIPTDRFKEVIRRLAEMPRYQIVLIGSGNESELKEFLPDGAPAQVLNLVNKTNLTELAVILREAECLVSLDSGPYHLAWMQKIPVVGIFVQEAVGSSPKRWGVYSNFSPHQELYKPSLLVTSDEIFQAIHELVYAK